MDFNQELRTGMKNILCSSFSLYAQLNQACLLSLGADRHCLNTVINNHPDYCHRKMLVGNKHTKNLPGFVSVFHSTFSYHKPTSSTLLKETLSNNSKKRKEALELFSQTISKPK